MKMDTAKRQSDGLIFLVLGIAIFVLFGIALRFSAIDAMADFRYVYNGTASLLAHHDPYSQSDFIKFQQEQLLRSGGHRPAHLQPVSLNLPPIFLIAVPFAVLPFGLASALWMILTAVSLAIAALLMWKQSAGYAPTLSGILVGVLTTNGSILLGNGNVAGIVAGLATIAVWCFLNGRFPLAGVLCLGFSLAMKPHDAALLWLFLLVAGSASRKRAWQVLAATTLLFLLAIAWLSHTAPNWASEYTSNLVASTSQGADSDPGPSGLTTEKRTMEEIIDLQAAVSILRDDPRFYNPVTYLVCGAFLLVWATKTMGRSGREKSPETAWFAVAAIIPLTLLLTYHRAYDSRLLLLTIPACCILWARGGTVGKLAFLTNIAAIIFTGEIPLAALNHVTKSLHPDTASLWGKVLTLAIMRPASIALLVMEIFYLWAYLRQPTGNLQVAPSESAMVAS